MTKEQIGKEIGKAVAEKKISYRQIRELTGLNHGQVQDIVNNRTEYTFVKLIKLMEVLNIKFSGIEDC